MSNTRVVRQIFSRQEIEEILADCALFNRGCEDAEPVEVQMMVTIENNRVISVRIEVTVEEQKEKP